MRTTRDRRITLAISIASLLFFFALALDTTTAKTATADEGMHLLRGQTLWQTGELGLQGQHTPLSHWLIGILLPTDSTVPDVSLLPSWSSLSRNDLVQEFLWQNGAKVDRILFLGRFSIVLVGLLLGALLIRWAGNLSGAAGQYIVASLYAFSPNLLASSALATTDLVAAATFIAALYALWRYWQRPSSWRWLLAGIMLGLALASKLTGVVILPITLLLCYTNWRNRPWWRPGIVWLSLLIPAGLILWAVYRFEVGPINGFPLPVPAATFVSNFVEVQQHIERGHFAYLLGERSNDGWWHYFGVVFLVKTPAVVLLLLMVTVIYLTVRRRWGQTIYLWLPAIILFFAASYSRLNIGYRHILPILPLVWLLIADTASFWRSKRTLFAVLILALGAYAIGSFRQAPHFLAYFNEFIGGSDQGYRYLGDSNIDWGQDLRLLVDYVESTEPDSLFVSYFGANDTDYYNLGLPPLFDNEGNPINFSPANPSPGRYVISVNHLLGGSNTEPDLFAWFKNQEPVDNLGYSILIYDVPANLSGSWIAHCLDPVSILDEATASSIVGQDSSRHTYFDCRQSWILPAGDEAGWYILPQGFSPDLIETIFPNELILVYENTQSAKTQPYNVYFWPGKENLASMLTDMTMPITLADGAPVDLPLGAAGVAQLLGGWTDGSYWTSVWQVLNPTNQPLSLQMHLYAGQPTPIVVDGLGFTTEHWHTGDIFFQYHQFETPSGQFLETGIYDFTTGAGLELEGGSELQVSARIYKK